jgi:N-acetylneuraminate lyase
MKDYLDIAHKVIANRTGIKFTHDDLKDYKRCLEFRDRTYDILFGRDEFLLDGLKAGASGAVGSTYNIMVGLYQELVKAFQDGDLEKAHRLQSISADTCSLLHNTGAFGSGLKSIMRMIGLDLGGMRHPQLNLSEKSVMDLKQAVEHSEMIRFLNKA